MAAPNSSSVSSNIHSPFVHATRGLDRGCLFNTKSDKNLTKLGLTEKADDKSESSHPDN